MYLFNHLAIQDVVLMMINLSPNHVHPFILVMEMSNALPSML